MHTLRKILWPFSILYGLVIKVRNFLYDRGIFRSVSFGIPVICVGNLSVGGTGKTPMVEYLVQLLKADFRTATLSRGYRRRSKGFVLAGPETGVDQLGDEPCQYHEKFPDVDVAVDADRVNGINRLIRMNPAPEVVILDDAFQHRKVKAGLNILLTSRNSLYTEDIFLPAGNLRDSRSEAERANIIVVTKCREDMKMAEREEIIKQLSPGTHQKVFFTSIAYSEEIVSLQKTVPLADWKEEHFTLVTGIANAAPLVEFLKNREFSFEHCNYPDHHDFSDSELQMLREKGKILTTEKDFMRLKDRLGGIFFIGIQPVFLFGQQEEFNRLICGYVQDDGETCRPGDEGIDKD